MRLYTGIDSSENTGIKELIFDINKYNYHLFFNTNLENSEFIRFHNDNQKYFNIDTGEEIWYNCELL